MVAHTRRRRALAPVLIRRLVILTVAIDAFLVPFDSASVFTETRGATLPKLVGLLAGAVLLGAGLKRDVLFPDGAPNARA